MFTGNTQILENIDNQALSKELEIARFRNFGREKFGNVVQRHISYDDFVYTASKHFSINLPKEISEYYIRIETAPYFAAMDSPALERIENILLKNRDNSNFIANHREIKNYYSKWVAQKDDKGRNYYALTLINMVERNFIYQSFYNLVLYGIVLTYEKSVFAPQKAIELFERSKELITNLVAEKEEKESILYLVNLYEGFTYYKLYEYQNAYNSFSEATKKNPYGISAKAYKGLTAVYLNNYDIAFDCLKEVLNFDKVRLKLAINYNHLRLFDFFYKTAAIYNIFAEDGFAPMTQDIDFLLRAQYSEEKNSMKLTYGKLVDLYNLRNKQFYNDKIIAEVEFLKEALDRYKERNDGLIRIVEQVLRNKLILLIEYLRSIIESHYYDQVKEEFHIFDKQIEQNKRQLELIHQESEDAIRKVEITKEEKAVVIKEEFDEQIKILEEKIEKVENDTKYNSTQTFFNSMIFTTVFAFVVAFLGGIATMLISSGDESAISLIIKGGLRWGGGTFVIGIIISAITAISAQTDKAKRVGKLQKELERIKNLKEEELELLEEEKIRTEQAYHKKFDERIKNQEKIIESFLVEREFNYKKKQDEAKKQIEVYTKPLNKLLDSFHIDG
jgi:hypothetical protein